MKNKRQQLTLFVPEKEAILIEKVRKKYNPLQYDLIASHVTLCREDEIIPIEKVLENIRNQTLNQVKIDFDQVNRFSEGKGLLLPSKGANISFQALRKRVLQGIISEPRNHLPHITLMHPRNSTCTDLILNKSRQLPFSPHITFTSISLIEQEIGKEWEVLEVFPLVG